MKTTSLKSTVAGFAAAAMLLTSGIVPTVTAAHAETVAVHGLAGKIQPLTPGPCLANPGICNFGNVKNPPPPPPPPPAPPAPGMKPGTAAAIGIVGGIIVGAALANASKPKTVVVPSSPASAHYDWCFGKYKSYRMEDNSFQPYHGPRKPCISPYL